MHGCLLVRFRFKSSFMTDLRAFVFMPSSNIAARLGDKKASRERLADEISFLLTTRRMRDGER